MSEYDLFNKFKEEYCSNCTNECTEESTGIKITYNTRTKLKCAKCDEYRKKILNVENKGGL